MKKALSAFVLSLVCMAMFAGNHLSKPLLSKAKEGVDSSIVMQDVTVLGNREKDLQMRSSVNYHQYWQATSFKTILQEA